MSRSGAELADTTPDEDPAALVEAAALWLADGRIDEAADAARQAALLGASDERTWSVLAAALEAQDDVAGAYSACEEWLKVAADPQAAAPRMARLALRLGHHETAEYLLAPLMDAGGADPAAVADLALAQACLGAFDRAQETLKAGLTAAPGESLLWIVLGEVLALQGRQADCVVFFEEALRLDPASGRAKDGLADALLSIGERDRALVLGSEALADAAVDEAPVRAIAQARRLLASGQLAEGWALHARAFETGPLVGKAAAPRWSPPEPLPGPILLLGEESVADEILLAHAVSDLIAAGHSAVLAVRPVWVELAGRSFPGASAVRLATRRLGRGVEHAAELVTPYMQEGRMIGAWTPLRSLPALYRATPAAFATRRPYLTADPERVAAWRSWLDGLGPGLKAGLIWRSALPDSFGAPPPPPLGGLSLALTREGVEVVSLQDRGIMGEADWLRDAFGLRVHEAPGLDLKTLDDLAALACALDVVIGPPDGVTYLAAACGVRTWFLAPERHWAMLGQDEFPWFPEARAFRITPKGGWAAAMAELSDALDDLAG